MKFEILKQKENPLLKRKELSIGVDYGAGATPSRAKMQEEISKELKSDIEKTEICKIFTEYGKAAGKIFVNIWDEKKVAKAKTEEKKDEMIK